MSLTKTLFLGALLAAVAILILVFAQTQAASASNGNHSTLRCTTSTVAAATVGHQLSSTILAANSNRAWARIQQPVNATNTVAVAFNGGTAATLGSGLPLTPATTTSPVAFIDFGLNTDFPYVGDVTAITNAGSTTVQVTQCLY